MRLVSAIYNDYYPFEYMGIVDSLFATRDPNDLKSGDILVVWGGEDIHPKLYGHKVHPYTGVWNDHDVSVRDATEWALMQRAVELEIPIIGVCRGAQMLCALAGGWLIQDVNYHAGVGEHEVITHDGQTFMANSLHHQMMYPFGVDHEMLAWTKPLSDVYNYADKHNILQETSDWMTLNPEFVYFPKVKGFAVQWHPEYTDYPDTATEYVFNFIETTLAKQHETA